MAPILAVIALLSAAEPPAARPEGADRVIVDGKAGEVRIPGYFVNPTRSLDVFACQEAGPTHETVVAFHAEGEEIHRALRAIGLRGPRFWNATSPRDLAATGGDRVTVWIRWEWQGKTRELLAEEALQEDETGLPLFARGFSFAAEPVMAGDPPRLQIPPVVEFTIGGQARQSACFTLLDHPDNSPELLRWLPACVVSPRAIGELEGLASARTPCAIIVRRIRSEAEFIELVAGREADLDRLGVRRAQRPAAALIDGKKREFEGLQAELGKLLEAGEGSPGASAAEKEALAGKLRALLARGARLAAEIHLRYLELWMREEAWRLAKIEGDARLDPERRAGLALSIRGGLRFELAIARRRFALAARGEERKEPPAAPVAEPPDGPLGAQAATGAGAQTGTRAATLARSDDPASRALEAEIEALELERQRRWAGFQLEHRVRPRLRELDPKKEAYTRELFQEDEVKILADRRFLRARVEELHAEVIEARSRSGGAAVSSSIVDPARFALWRAETAARRRLAECEQEEPELLEKVRWAKNPTGGASDPPDGKDLPTLERELKAQHRRAEELRAKLREARLARKLPAEDSPDAPPSDEAGRPIVPEDVE